MANNKKKGMNWENKVEKCINSGSMWFDKGDLKTDDYVIECIEENQLILMADYTLKPIKNIKIGDKIIGINENLNCSNRNKFQITIGTVTNKLYKGKQEIGELKLKDRSLFLTPTHKVLVQNICNNHWAEIGKSYNSFVHVYKPNITNYNIYLQGMLLGLINADGWTKKYKTSNYYFISQKISCDTVEWLFKQLNIKYVKHERQLKQFEYYIQDKNIINQNYKRLEKFNNFDLMYGWLSGFIIGDGHIQKSKKGRFTIGQNSNNPSYKTLLTILTALNIQYNIQNNKNYNKTINLSLTSIPFTGFGHKFNTFKTYLQYRTISSLEKNKFKFNKLFIKKPVWDIETTCNSFIANGIVVHNCKFTEKKGYRVTAELLNKLWNESLTANKLPMLVVGIKDDNCTWMLKIQIERRS